MFEILLKTREFIDNFAKEELKSYFKIDFKTLHAGLYEIKFSNSKEMIDFVSNVMFYSRCFKNIFLKITSFNKQEEIKNVNLDFLTKNFTFEINATSEYLNDKKSAEKYFGNLINQYKNLEVNLSNPDLSFHIFTKNNISYLGLDLLGFNLSKRDYKLNINHLTINSLVVIYGLNLLNINNSKKYTVVDPLANLGDLIIESSLYLPRTALNMQKRFHIPLYKIFAQNISIIDNESKAKQKFIGIVQNNKIFKSLRENINFYGTKIKMSQYDLNWLDVKFQKGDADYIISQLPIFKEEEVFNSFLEQFFYQIEFILLKKGVIISKKKISDVYYKKYKKLKLEKLNEILVGEQSYFIYLFSKV